MRILAVILGLIAGFVSGLYGVVALLQSDSFAVVGPSAPVPPRIAESHERKVVTPPEPPKEMVVIPKVPDEMTPPMQTENVSLSTAPVVAPAEEPPATAIKPLPRPPAPAAAKPRVQAKAKPRNDRTKRPREADLYAYHSDDQVIFYRIERPRHGFFGSDW
jgi:hypothetical protein